MSQLWAGCNTVLIKVAPHWLFVNNTDVDVSLVVRRGETWTISKHQILAPPVICVSTLWFLLCHH